MFYVKHMFLLVGLILFISIPVHAQVWKDFYKFNPSQTLQKVRFYDKNFGITVGSLYNGSTKNIHITHDGGQTWEDVSSGYTGTRFMDIFFQSKEVIFMSGNDGLMLRSKDGGLHWTTLKTGTTEQLWGVYFQNANIGFAVGSRGVIIRTRNGGDDWEVLGSGTTNLFYDAVVTSSGVWFASGSNVLLRSENGGDSWEPVDFFPFEAPADWIRSIQFVNANTGYACADIGRIYKTVDAGKTWSRLPSITQDPLFELSFLDENYGFICGFNGVILKTEDGGQSWIQMVSPLGTEHLYSIDLVDRNTAYISTHFGHILKLQESTENEQLFTTNLVSVFPNPAQDHICLEGLDETITEALEMQIVRLDGLEAMNLSAVQQSCISIAHLAPGHYFFQGRKGSHVFRGSFFKS